jgi:DNA-binding MarR family transcriptional regulator
MQRGLGTQLRHLLDLLDGAVADAYAREGLSYRPRYTPVMRALIDQGSLSIGQIAEAAGITQPAATQTVNLMVKEGLVEVGPGLHDGRQRLVSLSALGLSLLPQLQACWRATAAAAAGLDAELPAPLSQVLEAAIAALERQPFGERLQAARLTSLPSPSSTTLGA